MSWFCSCGLHNSGLNAKCAGTNHFKTSQHLQISSNTLDELRLIVYMQNLKYSQEDKVTDKEELFVKFYQRGKTLVSAMTDSDLRDHREGLHKIVIEAKASFQAADDEIRERDARKKSKDREWLRTVDNSVSVSDALNTIKTRKERMSKLDKARENLLKAGIAEDIVNEMIKGLEKGATEKSISVTSNLANIRPVESIKSDGTKVDFSKLSFLKRS